MQCSCGGDTAASKATKDNNKHVLEFDKCRCGRQGRYIYKVDGAIVSNGELAKSQFASLGGYAV